MRLCWLLRSSTRRTALQRLLPVLERTPIHMVDGTPTGPGRLGLSACALWAADERRTGSRGDGAASVRTWHAPTNPCFYELSTGFPQRVDVTQPSKIFTRTWGYSGMLDSDGDKAGRSSRGYQDGMMNLAT